MCFGTALHAGKDFAVSAGLNRVVSVRTSRLAACGRYPLPVSEYITNVMCSGVFGLSSEAHNKLCARRLPVPVRRPLYHTFSREKDSGPLRTSCILGPLFLCNRSVCPPLNLQQHAVSRLRSQRPS